MTDLQQTIQRLADPTFFERGASYAKQGLVSLVEREGGFVWTRVEGNDTYDVLFDLDRASKELRVTCSCRFFARVDLCKHVCAAAAHLKDIGERVEVPSTAQLVMVPARDQDEDDLHDDPQEAWDEHFEDFENDRDDDEGIEFDDPDPFDEDFEEAIMADDDGFGGALELEREPDPQKWLRWRAESTTRAADVPRLSAILDAVDPSAELDFPIEPGEHRLWYDFRTIDGAGGDQWLAVAAIPRTLLDSGLLGSPRVGTYHQLSGDLSLCALDHQIISGLMELDGLASLALTHLPVVHRRTLPARTAVPFVDGAGRSLIHLICATGRAIWKGGERRLTCATESLRIGLRIARHGPGSEAFLLDAFVESDQRRIDREELEFVTSDGWTRIGQRLTQLEPQRLVKTVRGLIAHGPMSLSSTEARQLVLAASQAPHPPRIDSPDDVVPHESPGVPEPILLINAKDFHRLSTDVRFDYGATRIEPDDERDRLVDPDSQALLTRDRDGEAAAIESLREHVTTDRSTGEFLIDVDRLADVVETLNASGWKVFANDSRLRPPSEFTLDVSSGVDWFDVRGGASFGDGLALSLPRLLEALRKNRDLIKLDDGSFGMLPERWLGSRELLLRMGKPDGEAIRFGRNQALWVGMLTEGTSADVDQEFAKAHRAVRRGAKASARKAPRGFKGELRPYQQDGLGWLGYLHKIGLGGCLADEMGLGKTVQVLAHLAAVKKTSSGPSLVVVPRSLVFNWREEAGRFTPGLTVETYTGPKRKELRDRLAGADLILTTYAILQRDADFLAGLTFDSVILDEAQAIKNPRTATCRAARRLNAGHRIAMSGTPVENHLGELGSILEFLNPGMLGGAPSDFLSKPGDDDALAAVSRALRPLILRRTKEQVAPDLPARLEQTLLCELDAPQRRHYDELRRHYQESLLDKAKGSGLRRMKIQVLEALLRLRQAACHVGLLDPDRAHKVGSAKFELLLPRLEEIVQDGEKALVFSQFTSLLALLRQELDERELRYEYLDGKVTDRQERVERFQTDPDSKLFLISLKAGGLGLNLTAARYVFLLDPWWNPAVEAQAIDRTHRIGQSDQVFAFRLIARDTVEEKIAELQQSKRRLADAILSADNALLRELTVDDLRLLLS